MTVWLTFAGHICDKKSYMISKLQMEIESVDLT